MCNKNKNGGMSMYIVTVLEKWRENLILNDYKFDTMDQVVRFKRLCEDADHLPIRVKQIHDTVASV